MARRIDPLKQAIANAVRAPFVNGITLPGNQAYEVRSGNGPLDFQIFVRRTEAEGPRWFHVIVKESM